jgi:hypothetical protein
VKTVDATLDGAAVTNGQVIDLHTLALGKHTLVVNAMDKAGNPSSQIIEFNVITSIDSLMTSVQRFYKDGSIKNKGLYLALMEELKAAKKSAKPSVTSALLNVFIQHVKVHRGKLIKTPAADLLMTDARWVIVHLPDTTAPIVKILSPRAMSYPRSQTLWIDFDIFDTITGVQEFSATLDGAPVTDHQKISLRNLALGEHTLVVTATDYAGNTTTKSVTFKVKK